MTRTHTFETEYGFEYKIVNNQLTLADQELALSKPEWAYYFARDVKGANIEKCQEAACKDPGYAYLFALYVKGADIEKCRKAACKDPYWAYWFARKVPGANIEKCREACKGTIHEF